MVRTVTGFGHLISSGSEVVSAFRSRAHSNTPNSDDHGAAPPPPAAIRACWKSPGPTRLTQAAPSRPAQPFRRRKYTCGRPGRAAPAAPARRSVDRRPFASNSARFLCSSSVAVLAPCTGVGLPDRGRKQASDPPFAGACFGRSSRLSSPATFAPALEISRHADRPPGRSETPKLAKRGDLSASVADRPPKSAALHVRPGYSNAPGQTRTSRIRPVNLSGSDGTRTRDLCRDRAAL
jgi:hypothetical protein